MNNSPELYDGFLRLVSILRPRLICDIGSMDAEFGIAFKRASQTSQVISFEANPYNYAAAVRAGRAAAAGVDWEYIAISDHDGVATFNATTYARDEQGDVWTKGGSSLLALRHPDVVTEKLSVPCMRLDTYLGERGLLHCGKLIWMDVEGANDLVLMGAPEALKSTFAIHLEVEAKPMFEGQKLDRDVVPMLEAAGFLPWLTGDEGGAVQYDVLLIHRDLIRMLAV